MFYYSKTTNCSYKKTVDRFCFYTNLSTVPSKKMVDSLLVSKFVQGIPFVGALGGAANYVVLTNISKMAKLKYKKRFINKL